MSPPPSPNGKTSSRNGHAKILLLLLGLIIIALSIGGLLFFQFYSTQGEDDLTTDHSINNTDPHFEPSAVVPIVGRPNQMGHAATERPPTPTTTTSTTTRTTTGMTTMASVGEHAEIVIEEEEEEEDESTEEQTETTDENTIEEEKEDKTPSESTVDVDVCRSVAVERTSCGHVPRLSLPLIHTPLSLLHYSLNLTTSYVSHFIGDSEIFVRPKTLTNQIILGASRHLRSLESVTVLDCTSGEPICSSVQHDTSQEILSISLSIPTSSLLRIIITQYHSISAPSLYSQVPASFNRQLPSVVGTQFQSDADAKQLFPTVLGSGVRAPLSLCLFHSDTDAVSSSSPSFSSRGERSAPDGKTTTCFHTTQPLQQRDYAFLTHHKTESLFFNRTSPSMPELDVVFSFTQGFSPSHHEWIHEETHKVIAAVSDWTSFGFPLSRLTLVDAPIPVSHSLSPLGFIVLKSGSLLGNPKVATMRNSLMRQVISQWIGGVVSSEMCVEDALVTYLQWRINDEIAFIPSQANTTHKIRESRPSSLVSKPKRGRLSSVSSSSPCPDRLPSIFHSLDSLYGQSTVQSLVRRLFSSHSFTHIPLSQLATLVADITGDESAGAYVRDWFTVSSRPLLMGVKTREGMNVTQMAAPNKEINLWRMPLEMEGTLVDIKPELHQLLLVSSPPLDCFVLDPRRKSTAMIAYDVDTYSCLIRCSASSRCSLSPSELDSIFADLGVFFTSNLLPVQQKHISTWKSVFSSLQSRSSLEGESKCCIDHSLRIAPSRDCAWTVNDICKKIDLSQAILTSV